MGREGLMDDCGYHGFEECSSWEACNEEAFETGKKAAAEELKNILEALKKDDFLKKLSDFEEGFNQGIDAAIKEIKEQNK